jgi:putative FmdB family regulatory protein
MPTYEYECTKCGHTFEVFQSIMDKPLSRCPECKSAVRRVINGGLGVIFKGSGFYSTDNKKGSVLGGGNGSSSRDKEKSENRTDSARSDSSGNGSSEKSSSEKSSAEKPSTEKKSEKKTTEKTTAS